MHFDYSDKVKSWQKTLFINQDTGATDLTVNPTNPNHLFAATYERRRTAWGFVGGGFGSKVFIYAEEVVCLRSDCLSSL